jgi:hypothetical protein
MVPIGVKQTALSTWRRFLTAKPRRTGVREERQAAVNELRDAVAPALQEIDEILDRFGGRRLSDQPTALGTVAVEATPAGIAALANSDYVKVILEDQPISLAR